MSESDENKNGPVATGPEQTDNQPGEVLLAKPEEAIAFLQMLYRNGPWTLVAIHPDSGKIIAKTFRTGDDTTVAARIAERNSDHNLYYQLNPTISDLSKKARREDIREVAFLHADLDARAGEDFASERSRIFALLQNPPAHVPPPTFIVDSGNGAQALWKLSTPIPVNGDLSLAEDAKLYNLALELALGADSAHNTDRILRLPGTVNFPNATKRAKGRVPVMARLVESHPERVYDIADFPKAKAPAQHSVSAGSDAPVVTIDRANVKRLASVDELPKAVSDTCKRVIVNGHDPLEPAKHSSRSEWLFHVVCELVRAGLDNDAIFGVITDPAFLISASVLDKGSNAEKYALRQIAQAKKEKANEATTFQTSDNGANLANQHNIRVALRQLGVRVSYDTFANRLLVAGLADFGPVLSDAAATRLWLLIDQKFAIRPAYDFFVRVMEDEARLNRFHPVCDYLDDLSWDKTPRIDRWLTTYAGAEDNEFVRAVGAMVLIAAVRRVRTPGCKFDEMLVLEGPQGQGKSSLLQVLAMKADWHTDDLPLSADTKRQIEALAGRWIVEAGELKGMRKGDVETLKSFLSRREDRARMAYGRLTTELPRQCVIVGTTNSVHYLKDSTGNRRFWPVRVGAMDLAALKRDRDQLWAEAAHREAEGASIRLEPALYPKAAEAQEGRRVEDPFLQRLAEVLNGLVGKLRSEGAWKIIGVPSGHRTPEHNVRLGEAMKELGWEHEQRRFGGPLEYAYARGEKHERLRELVVHRDDANDKVWVVAKDEKKAQPKVQSRDDERSPF